VAVVALPATALGQGSELGTITNLHAPASVIRAATGQSVPLAFKDHVFEGDRIDTREGSVSVLLGLDSVATVRPRSSVTFTAANGSRVLTVASGAVRYSVDRTRVPSGAVYEVRTPNAIVRLRGTVLLVEFWPLAPVPPGPLTRICVLSGMVSASTLDGEEIQIGPDGCTFIEDPPPPRLREAPSRSTIGRQ